MTIILPQVLQVALSRGVQVAVLVVGVAGGGLEMAVVTAPAITVASINTALETWHRDEVIKCGASTPDTNTVRYWLMSEPILIFCQVQAISIVITTLWAWDNRTKVKKIIIYHNGMILKECYILSSPSMLNFWVLVWGNRGSWITADETDQNRKMWNKSH